jgi:hypothetical protein
VSRTFCSGWGKFLFLTLSYPSYAISNPDLESERRLLTQLAPELSEDLVIRLVGAFHDLRQGYESGSLTYPYSLRGARHRFHDCCEYLTRM